MRVAIVTDSDSGITQAQGAAAGIYVIPMPFMIGERTYYEDVNLTQQEFYEKLREGGDISTSQPAPGAVLELWKRLLREHDAVIHIPLSSGLSSACENAHMLAADFGNRVLVVDNQRISVTLRQSILEAKAMADRGMSAKAIKDELERTGLDASIYITVDTLEYLKKGGRITPAAALLGTFLRIKPVLTIQGDKLDAFAKARTMRQAKSMMITAIRKDVEERFGGNLGSGVHMAVAHTNSEEAAQEFKQELKELFPGAGDIYVDHLSLSVSCHIGPGALAVACTKRLDM